MGRENVNVFRNRVASILAADPKARTHSAAISTAVDSGLLDDIVDSRRIDEWIQFVDDELNATADPISDDFTLVSHLALALAEQVARVLRGRDDDESHSLRGSAYWSAGVGLGRLSDDYERSADCLSRAVTSYMQAGKPLAAARCQVLWAHVLSADLGREVEAIPLYELALETYRTSGDTVEAARCQVWLANSLLVLRRPTEALALLDQAEAVLEGADEHPALDECHLLRSLCLRALGKRDEPSLDTDFLGIDSMSASGDPIRETLSLLDHAVSLQEHGHPADALPLLEQAEMLLDREEFRDFLAPCLMIHVSCLQDLDREAEAIPLCERAESAFEAARAAVQAAHCRLERADCLAVIGQVNESVQLYDQLIRECAQIGASADDVAWRARFHISMLLAANDKNDFGRAQVLLQEALSMAERLATTSTRLQDRIGIRESQADAYRTAVRFDLFGGDVKLAFQHAQQAKGRALLDLVHSRVHVFSDPLEQELEGLTTAENEVLDLLERSQGERQQELTKQLDRIRQQRVDSARTLAVKQPGRALLTTGAVRSLQELAQVLHPGEMLLDVLDGSDFVATFLLASSGVIAAHAVDGGELDRVLERHRTEWTDSLRLLHSGSAYRETEALADLYDLLIRPLVHHLSDCCDRLIISPSGRLHAVPFAALWHIAGNGDVRYMYRDYQLCTVPTATSLWLLRTGPLPPREIPSLFAAAPYASTDTPGDPRIGQVVDPRRRSVARDEERELPYSGWEVYEVSRILEGCYGDADRTVLLGEQATLTSVQSRGALAHLLLLATHGHLAKNSFSLLDYQLQFSRSQTGEAVLSMREVFEGALMLRQAAHVSLTACHLGQVVLHGEEAMGFQQAFLSAGARTTLAPLWPVDDAATAVLSVEFHRALIQDKVSVTRAMQSAMDRVSSVQGWEHPFFWAGFLPSGDGAQGLLLG